MNNRKLEMIAERHTLRASSGAAQEQRDHDITDLLRIIEEMTDEALEAAIAREMDEDA
jgi:hypothetical protein